MSKWESYSDKKKDHKLDELIEEVLAGEMPLEFYTMLHGSISETEKEELVTWAKKARQNYDLE